MVESVIKCYALYLFLPCATRPNGSGHPGRCGNAACKGQNFHAELCPLSISPEIVGSRLNNGAASVFLGALGERHGGLQHALHCFWRKAPRFVIARRPEADVAISCRQLRFRRQLSHNPARYCEIATGAKRPRNDKSIAFSILTVAGTNRLCCAGPGCPLPYNARPETFCLPQALQYSARNVAFFSGTC